MADGGIGWRPMRARDLPAVDALADRAHPGHPEGPEVFAERLRLHPAGCLTLEDPGGAVLGYAVSHPWDSSPPPPLGAPAGNIPERPTALWIHDVALEPAVRGSGHGRDAAEALLAHARGLGLAEVAGAAVPAAAFWEGLGFRRSGNGARADGCVAMRRPSGG